jgi:hypothetical protein
MAVPALPSSETAGNVYTAAKVNAIYDHLQWHRDTGPVFKGQAWKSNFGLVSTSTTTTLGFGTGGSFENTPIINAGGWTVQGSDSDPESLVVPEPGLYAVTVQVRYGNDNTGYRRAALVINGTVETSIYTQVGAAPTQDTFISASGIIDVAAGAQLDIQAYQNSGSSLASTVYLSAHWIRST